jgi:methionyl-tRNA formyltransferase
MKMVAFCDESSIADLIELTKKHELLCVVAHNRPAAHLRARKLTAQWCIHGKIGTPQEQTMLRNLTQFEPDLVLSWSYGLRIPKSVLDLPKIGAVNVHGGLLPEWRGANILNWVLVEGATETGVTVHWMTEAFDEGPIIAKRSIKVDFCDTAETLRIKLHQLSIQLLRSLLVDIEHGVDLPSIPQDESRARYYKRRTPEDGCIRWDRSDIEIYNLIRALVAPWPGAFTITDNGDKVVFRDFVPIDMIESLRCEFTARETRS